MKDNWKLTALISLLISIITPVIYLSNLPSDFNVNIKNGLFRHVMVSADIVPNTFLPYLIIKERTVTFNTVYKLTKRLASTTEKPYFLIKTGDRYVSAYPILTGLLAVPIYFLPVVMNKIPTFIYHENILKIFALGRISASFYSSLSVVIFYLITTKFSKDTKWNILYTIFYAFGTATWSVSSRGLWQHTSSQFFNSLALFLLLLSTKEKKYIPWAGMILGFSVLARPTNIIFAATVALYIFINDRNFFVDLILPAIPLAIFFFFYNKITFGSFFVDGYGARSDYNWSTPLRESLIGYAFSPSRSFLFVSPPLLLAYYTMFKLYKTKSFGGEFNTILRFLSVSFVLSLLLFAKWYTWDGANAFGYRMLTDILPVVSLLAFLPTMTFNKTMRAVLLVLMLYSLYVHANAVFYKKSRCSKDNNWNFNCLTSPKRLWSAGK